MTVPAKGVAQYLLKKAASQDFGELLSNMKLQKLLYYCQGMYYAAYNKPLFNEKINAWQYGPVVPEIYHQLKTNGVSGIEPSFFPYFSEDLLSDEQKDIIDDVFDYFGQFSAFKLMEMTHSEVPWMQTSINDEIGQELMGNYFKQFLEK